MRRATVGAMTPRLRLLAGVLAAGAAGCSGSGTADIYSVQPVGSSLDVLIGLCNPDDLRVHVQESRTEVRLRATYSSHSESLDCAVTTRVELDSPLAGRTVVDDRTGDAVRVY